MSGEIRGLRGELGALEERTSYARVSVSLTDEGADGAESSTGEALDDALGTLLGAFNSSYARSAWQYLSCWSPASPGWPLRR